MMASPISRVSINFDAAFAFLVPAVAGGHLDCNNLIYMEIAKYPTKAEQFCQPLDVTLPEIMAHSSTFAAEIGVFSLYKYIMVSIQTSPGPTAASLRRTSFGDYS
jgi:hypothetical protein